MAATATPPLRAVGVVRVSQPGDRAGESYSSPRDQRDRIETLAGEQGWRLIDVHDEQHVSGDALLEDRPGLSRAVTAVLTGSAEVIVGAHTERLWWNHEVRAQVLRLVGAAGGEVWSADQGRLSNGSAADEFSGTVRTAADRLSRQQNAEKTRAAVARAIARGAWPAPRVPIGYLRGVDGVLEPDPATRDLVAQAFALRASGATVGAVREHLATARLEVSYAAAGRMLSSRAYIGEVHHGELANLEAHEPIVGRDVWAAVQRVKVPAGRRAKSERLLARLGIVRCGSCGGRMSASTGHAGTYAIYRCGAHAGDPCPKRPTIGAELVEGIVVNAVMAATADIEGRANIEQHTHDVEHELERTQADLEAAIRAFAGLEAESAAVERLGELRRARDAAQEEVDRLGGTRAAVTVNVARDWPTATLAERRALIRATVDSVTVTAGGRGAERVRVQLVGQ